MATVTSYEKLAWAAGIADGEGNFSTKIVENRPGHFIRQITFQVAQTNIEMHERLQEALGMGKIYQRKPPTNPKHAQRWDYRVTGYAQVQTVISRLWPWLGSIKQKQATEALLKYRSLVCREDFCYGRS